MDDAGGFRQSTNVAFETLSDLAVSNIFPLKEVNSDWDSEVWVQGRFADNYRGKYPGTQQKALAVKRLKDATSVGSHIITVASRVCFQKPSRQRQPLTMPP